MLAQKIRAPRGRLSNAAIAQGTNSWTNREKICLIEAVQAKGTDDWNEVSKFIRELTAGSRTKDWGSALNCARQFQIVMETVGRQIRKKGDMEKDLFTSIKQHFVDERLKELQIIMDDHRTKYMNLMKFQNEVEAGKHDDRVNEILSNMGTEAVVEDAQDESPGLFYFAELSDLTDKVSLIHSFIRNDMEATSPVPSKQGGDSASEDLVAPSTVMTTEEDDDLSDLMDILPTMETFDPDDLDASLMDTSAYEIVSPPDGTTTARKVPVSSPKVSPQLKNLVRTAIAGTLEDERPRKLTPSSGAPTLSMLLEMPPRDPGQPLPEISSVSKAVQNTMTSTSDHSKLGDMISSTKSQSATLELLNIALAQSPTKHQEKQIPNTSSSPTLQRLLEGAVTIKKEVGDTKPNEAPIVSHPPTFVADVEIKTEELDELVTPGEIPSPEIPVQSRLGTPLLPTVSSHISTDMQASLNNPEVALASFGIDSELQKSAVQSEAAPADLGSDFDTVLLDHTLQKTPLKEPVLEEANDSVDIKIEEVETTVVEDSTEPPSVITNTDAIEALPLPPDVQDKVSNLKDLVITQNVGVVTPKVSPSKSDSRTSPEVALPSPSITSVKEIMPATLTDETKAETSKTISPAKGIDAMEVVGEQEAVESNVEDSSVTMPTLTPVPLLPPTVSQRSDLKSDGLGKTSVSIPAPASLPEVEAMDEDKTYETKSGEQTIRDVAIPTATDLLDATDSDDDISNRKKVLIPSKTYSRKERYGIEPPSIDEEGDSSNSGFETPVRSTPDISSQKSSPPRAPKSPPKPTSSPDKKVRKSRFSESKLGEVEGGVEEETRVTRARSKPASPLKPVSANKLRTRTPEPSADTSAEQPSVATRSTRSSRASGVTPQSGASELVLQSSSVSRKNLPTEERDIQTPPDLELHFPGRTMRGRISSTSNSRVLDSLPGIAFESNPSSPSSSTTTSTNMDEDKEQRAFRKSVSILWEQIKSHKHAGQFLKPITDTMVPKYSKKIFQPMDLTTIKRHIDSGIIRSVQTFEREVYLMLMNATMYNSSDHEIHQRTLEMEQDVRSIIDNYKATQKALRASQTVESTGSEIIRSPVKLRNRARRSRKLSESDADEVAMEESHSGEHTPASGSDNEADDLESDRHAGQKNREGSPDIVSLASGTGNKRRSRTSSPSSVRITLPSAGGKGAAERASSVERRLRQTSPDVNSPSQSNV